MATSSNRPRKIYLDSDNRVSGTHDDFEVELPASVIGCRGMEPISVTVPLTTYPVPIYEQYLYYRSTFPSLAGVNLRATVDVNRNFTTVQELIDAVNYGVANTTIRMDTGASITGGVAFTWNNTKRKVEFSAAGAIQFVGYLDYGKTSPFYHNIAFRLGFANQYTGSSSYSTSDAFAAAFPTEYVFPSILRTTCIYVSCSLCQSDSITSSDNGNRDLLVKVPITSGDASLGSIIQYVNQMKDRTIESMPVTFKRIRIRLLDEEQNALGLAATGKGSVQVELRCFYD
jgi:hypothetical protein